MFASPFVTRRANVGYMPAGGRGQSEWATPRPGGPPPGTPPPPRSRVRAGVGVTVTRIRNVVFARVCRDRRKSQNRRRQQTPCHSCVLSLPPKCLISTLLPSAEAPLHPAKNGELPRPLFSC